MRLYLGNTQLNLKKLQLAERIADIFDTYAVYRPERVLGWDRGIETIGRRSFGAFFYRGKGIRIGPGSGERRLQSFPLRTAIMVANGSHLTRARLRSASLSLASLPFHGITLRVLKALADRIPVHLFLLNPSREYWADIVPERKIVSAERAEKERNLLSRQSFILR